MDYFFKSTEGKLGKGWTALEAIESAYGKETFDALPAIHNSGWTHKPENHADVSTLYAKQSEKWEEIGTIFKNNYSAFRLRAFAI